jgi:hypothetical protein
VHVRHNDGVTSRDDQVRHDRLVGMFVVLVLIAISLFVIWLATLDGAATPSLQYWPMVP